MSMDRSGDVALTDRSASHSHREVLSLMASLVVDHGGAADREQGDTEGEDERTMPLEATGWEHKSQVIR
jgi:hypothetical protein